MTTTHDAGADGGFFSSSTWKATWRLGAAYLACFLAINTVLWGLAGVDPLESFFGKLVLLCFCAIAITGMSALLYQLRRQSFGRRVLICLALAITATPLFTMVDHLIHMAFVYPKPVPVDPVYIGYSMIEGLALFFGWSCLSVAQIYSGEARDRERQLAAVREEALAAQMRALRYQVSPHFLFNTLNSIAGLIEEGASARANRMVLSLSDFLRATLALDPVQDVRLADELALQEDYLLIERERFSDRLDLKIEVPSALGDALLPSLLLQPLVENAIKHGVGATNGPVSILIAACRIDDRLVVTIENDMPLLPRTDAGRSGAGIGLRNVSERIRTRFAGQGKFSYGPVRPGCWRARIDLPWVLP
jgi:two-component system LytT family sensor kinase